MKWQEVIAKHGTIKGVAARNGQVLSVLAGSKGHNDDIAEAVIHYKVPKSHGYNASRKHLEAAFKDASSFTVYQKLAVNDWRDLGMYKVQSQHEGADSVTFCLIQGNYG